MGKSGVLQYKCRRCGEIDTNTHVPDIDAALLYAVRALSISIAEKKNISLITMHEIHSCKDGGTGISDLIGGVIDKRFK